MFGLKGPRQMKVFLPEIGHEIQPTEVNLNLIYKFLKYLLMNSRVKTQFSINGEIAISTL